MWELIRPRVTTLYYSLAIVMKNLNDKLYCFENRMPALSPRCIISPAKVRMVVSSIARCKVARILPNRVHTWSCCAKSIRIAVTALKPVAFCIICVRPQPTRRYQSISQLALCVMDKNKIWMNAFCRCATTIASSTVPKIWPSSSRVKWKSMRWPRHWNRWRSAFSKRWFPLNRQHPNTKLTSPFPFSIAVKEARIRTSMADAN